MFDEFDEWDAAAPVRNPHADSRRLSGGSGWALAIVGGLVAIGLVLPTLISRGPDHRHQGELRCLSCIRQMGLGIQGYVEARNVYPPGTLPNPDLPLERRPGWAVAILRYIDQAEYASHEAGRLAWDDPFFAELEEHPPSIAHCPMPNGSNYVAIAGLGVDSPSLPTRDVRAGIFGDDRVVRPRDIKDGAANTMMLTESDTKATSWLAGGRATVRGLDPTRRPYLGAGRQFGGNHERGAVVLMADGSARIVAESVDPKIFEAMSTIAGREKTSLPPSN